MVQIRSLVSWALSGGIEPGFAWPVMMLPTAAAPALTGTFSQANVTRNMSAPLLRLMLAATGMRVSYGPIEPVSLASRTRQLIAHVWTALLWQVQTEVLQSWSVRPCVRPVGAARMTAGHNAFREDGSRSKARARSAWARLGFPVFRYRPAFALHHVRTSQL